MLQNRTWARGGSNLGNDTEFEPDGLQAHSLPPLQGCEQLAFTEGSPWGQHVQLPLPLSGFYLSLEHTNHALPQGLCICCLLSPDCPPTPSSLTLFRSELKGHPFREAILTPHLKWVLHPHPHVTSLYFLLCNYPLSFISLRKISVLPLELSSMRTGVFSELYQSAWHVLNTECLFILQRKKQSGDPERCPKPHSQEGPKLGFPSEIP